MACVSTCLRVLLGIGAFAIAWPWLDASCSLIPYLPHDMQLSLADYHAVGVPAELRKVSKGSLNVSSITTLCGYKSEHEVIRAVRETHQFSTVLFKRYLDKDQTAWALQRLQERTAGKQYWLQNYSNWTNLDTPGFGGLFSIGMDPHYKAPLVNMTLDGIWDGTKKDIYGSFAPVGEERLHEIFNFTTQEAVPDTSFFGWFSRKSVTTPIHANWPADTLSVQLAGKKQWLFVDPLDMKSVLSQQGSQLLAGSSGGVFYTNLYFDSNLASRLRLVTQEPGDLLYFPPYAAHAVVTDAGLNVMTALRFQSVVKAFKIHPWKTLQAAIGYAFEKALIHPITMNTFYHVMNRRSFTGAEDGVLEAWLASASASALASDSCDRSGAKGLCEDGSCPATGH